MEHLGHLMIFLNLLFQETFSSCLCSLVLYDHQILHVQDQVHTLKCHIINCTVLLNFIPKGLIYFKNKI